MACSLHGCKSTIRTMWSCRSWTYQVISLFLQKSSYLECFHSNSIITNLLSSLVISLCFTYQKMVFYLCFKHFTFFPGIIKQSLAEIVILIFHVAIISKLSLEIIYLSYCFMICVDILLWFKDLASILIDGCRNVYIC